MLSEESQRFGKAKDVFPILVLPESLAKFPGRKLWFAGLSSALIALLTGCQSARYYQQAFAGQMEILRHQGPIAEVLADDETSPVLRERLQLVLKLRAFAATELQLPVDKHYLRYADLGRRFVVWNVDAAPEFSLEPKTWWYPLVGRLEYRGYFREADALRYAEELKPQGFDVSVGGVEAYSTLGWFRDPVLNTFVFHNDTELAELLFHELAHQIAFASGDTDFNEAFATAVAEEGVRRWWIARPDQQSYEKYRSARKRRAEFVNLISAARAHLERLYKETPAGAKRSGPNSSPRWNESELRAGKQRICEQLRRDYEQLRATWDGAADFDDWFRSPLNNALLNTVDTYYKFVPAFRELLRRGDDDLARFYKAAKALSKLAEKERHRALEPLLSVSEGSR